MKHQADNVRSLVYQYGAVPTRIAPVEGEDRALDQMRLAGRLWNLLTAIERVRIQSYRRIMRDEVHSQIDQLRERKRALINERDAQRKQARAKVSSPDIEDELKSVSAKLQMLIEHNARNSQLTALNERTLRRIKRARRAAASLGLFWGTYNAVLQAADTGRQSGGELQFRSFRVRARSLPR